MARIRVLEFKKIFRVCCLDIEFTVVNLGVGGFELSVKVCRGFC